MKISYLRDALDKNKKKTSKRYFCLSTFKSFFYEKRTLKIIITQKRDRKHSKTLK